MKIRFKKNKVGHLMLKGSINGRKSLLIVDTGASNTVLDSGTVEKLLLKPKKTKQKAAGIGTTSMKIGRIRKLNITLKRTKLSIKTAAAMDLSHVNHSLKAKGAKPVAGVIGADILRKYRAVIDYGAGTIRFRDTR